MSRRSVDRVTRAAGTLATLLLTAMAVTATAFTALSVPATVSAQTAMHREVPRGEITGLEMAIEGSLQATPGAPVRWWITLYEVVRRRDLRPAASCVVRAMASHDRSEPVATVSTDADGRAALSIPMPDDLDESPHLVLDATCPRGVRRLFDVDLSLEARERLVLTFDRAHVPPEGTALAIGRVLDRATGRGIPGVTVSLAASQDGPLGAARTLTSDAAGMFAALVEARASTSTLSVSAHTVHEHGPIATASAGLSIQAPSAPPPLTVRIVTTPAVAAPGALVDVLVEVRGPDGAPVADALVSGPDRDPLPPGSPPEAVLPEIRTDARGVAHHPWRLSRELEAGALVPLSTGVQVTSASFGSASSVAQVRVARRASFVTLALAGGVLVPGAPARVIARVVGPDGLPLAGRDVELTSAILGSVDGAPVATARTDASGLAAFDVARVGDAVADECGGTTATELVLAVGGESTSVCAPVDPDAPVTVVAPPRLAPGSSVSVAIHRTPRAAGRPVIVTALRRGLGGWEPIAQGIASPSASALTLAPGADATGEVWVRARVAMADGQVVRGASTLVSFAPAPGELHLEADRAGARVSGAVAGESVLVLTRGAPMGEGLELVPLLAGDLSADATTASLAGLALEAALAIRVPVDFGASAILRDGQVVAQAMPEEPVTLGLLRDPWRTRARFVRGRLGRLFLAVEELVESRIPDRLGEVASPGPRGWTWNREMLAAAVREAYIDDEGSASLDGQPLDIDALVALDPTFTFDHVARRITRKRLFRVVRAMREMTDERNLDVPWARRGDPRTWITSLVGVGLSDGSSLETDDLFDAWGRAFVFRPTRRASFLPAIAGWEVASLGPDGRDGTADDVFDPFARAVPSGSLYADAVGEDALVARLSGVALGRAFVAQLEEEYGESSEGFYVEEAEAVLGPLADAWGAAPAPLEAVPTLARPARLARQPGALLGEARAHTWALPPERSAYTAVAIAVPPEGRPRVATATFEAGARIALRTSLPEVLRVGDVVRIPVVASALEGGGAPPVSLSVTGSGLTAHLDEQDSSFAGTSSARIVIEATAPGAVELVIEARGADTLTVRRRIRVLPRGAVFATHAGALLVDGARLGPATPAPGTARVLGSQLSVASPRALDRSPFFEALAADGADAEGLASVLAWARALGGSLDASLAARASRSAASGSRPLTDACALVALSTTTEHLPAVSSLRGRIGASATTDLRERASVLVALAGVVSAGVAPDGDPVAATVAGLRVDGWRALATEQASPAVMARVAAGLLLADEDDGPGRALYRSALAALRPGPHGERSLPGDPSRVGDGWIGTLALALAARQVGDDALADELAAAAMRELHLVRRTGAEGAFWALAASVYGAFGGAGADGRVEDAPTELSLDVGGATRAVPLEGGAASVEVTASDTVTLRGGRPVLATLETRAVREVGERRDAAFDARVEGVLGDAGRLGEAGARAALELVVEAGDADVPAPIIELELPSLAALDEVARGALSRSPAVARVEGPDRGGIVRLVLQPLSARSSARVPLVLSWLGAGRVHGLAVVAYDAATPSRMTTHAARVIELGRAVER